MKLLSVLTVCAALCIVVTQASSLARAEEETNQASVQELLEMLQAEAQDDIDEEAIADLATIARKISNNRRAKSQFIGTALAVGVPLVSSLIRGWKK